MSKILIVEDEEMRLMEIVEIVKLLPDCEILAAPSSRLADYYLENNYFDYALVDLNLDRQATISQGIIVCERIRKKSLVTVIIAFSSGIQKGMESDKPEVKACLEAGADAVKSRQEVVNRTSLSFQSMLLELQQQRIGLLRSQRRIILAEDPLSKAVCDVVPERLLMHALFRLLPDGKEDAIKALGGGFSGAMVLFVKTVLLDGQVCSNVLKVSRSGEGLREEFVRAPVVGSAGVLQSVPMRYFLEEIGGWDFSLSEGVMDGLLLRDYLRDTGITKGVKKTLGIIVNGLNERALQSDNNAASSADKYVIDQVAAAGLYSALDELSDASALVSLDCIGAQHKVRSYVDKVLSGDRALIHNRKIAICHGDFHSKNILVTTNSGIKIIDFARRGRFPRLTDYACLDANIMLGSLGYFNGEQFNFGSSLTEICNECVYQFPFQSTVNMKFSGSDLRDVYLRGLLLESLKSIPDSTRFEYAEILLTQLLRYARFINMPSSRRLLAIVLAARLIDVIEGN